MKALIASYERSRHLIHFNQAIIKLEGINDKKAASKYIGTKIVFKTKSGRMIKGFIKDVHGDNGRLRARFERGLPGQAIGQEINLS